LRSDFHVKTIASHRTVTASADGTGLLSHAGSLLLLKTLHVTGPGPGVIGPAGALATSPCGA
jgi:hypothetical protein